jgi:hypothetical protein
MQAMRFKINPIHAKLEYVQTILSKVSFDAHLFKKELRKAISILRPEDIRQLEQWCYSKFGPLYEPILEDCFAQRCAS